MDDPIADRFNAPAFEPPDVKPDEDTTHPQEDAQLWDQLGEQVYREAGTAGPIERAKQEKPVDRVDVGTDDKPANADAFAPDRGADSPRQPNKPDPLTNPNDNPPNVQDPVRASTPANSRETTPYGNQEGRPFATGDEMQGWTPGVGEQEGAGGNQGSGDGD